MLFQGVMSQSLLPAEPDAQHMLAPSSMSVSGSFVKIPMFFEGPDAQHKQCPSSMSMVLFA